MHAGVGMYLLSDYAPWEFVKLDEGVCVFKSVHLHVFIQICVCYVCALVCW
jgi:hypothetical protein